HRHLGFILRGKGDIDGSLAAHREALRLDPRLDAGAVTSLLLASGEWDGLAAECRKLIQEDSSDAQAHHDLHYALQNLADQAGAEGGEGEAVRVYEDRIRQKPEDAEAYIRLASIAGEERRGGPFFDPLRAVEMARKAVELNPKSGNYLATLAECLYLAGD